jgi:hypothetical protein
VAVGAHYSGRWGLGTSLREMWPVEVGGETDERGIAGESRWDVHGAQREGAEETTVGFAHAPAGLAVTAAGRRSWWDRFRCGGSNWRTSAGDALAGAGGWRPWSTARGQRPPLLSSIKNNKNHLQKWTLGKIRMGLLLGLLLRFGLWWW